MTALGDADAQQRPLESRPGTSEVGRLLEALGECPFGLASSLLGLLDIDLGCHIRCFSHHDDLVRPNLEKTAGDREELLLAAPTNAQLPDSQSSQERRMVRQDAQLPLDPRTNDRVNFFTEDLAFRGDDLQKKRHG